MTEEEAKTKWCAVTGFEGLYEVSDAGEVRSLDRSKPYQGRSRRVAGCYIRPAVVSGYPRVALWKDGKSCWRFVHRLVAEAFVGPQPSPAHQINHKNGNRFDPRAVNLEWVTPSENQLHSFRELGRTVPQTVRDAAPKGEKNGRAKLSDDEVRVIRIRHHEQGDSCSLLGRVFGVHGATISRIVREESRGLAGKL